jgi:cell division protein FtsL
MLPVSLTRASTVSPQRMDARRAFAWMRPANTTSRTVAERRALVVWLAFFGFAGVLIALGHVWLRLQVLNVGYQLSATREVIERLQQEEHELTLELATLEAPARLEEEARVRLGMIRPEKGQEALLP